MGEYGNKRADCRTECGESQEFSKVGTDVFVSDLVLRIVLFLLYLGARLVLNKHCSRIGKTYVVESRSPPFRWFQPPVKSKHHYSCLALPRTHRSDL